MNRLRRIWSSTDFGASELTRYAGGVMRREARQGIFVLGMLTMLLMSGLAGRGLVLDSVAGREPA